MRTAANRKQSKSRSLPPSNKPTRGFRNHHDTLAPEISRERVVAAWRVRSRLQALFEKGEINIDELAHAEAWRKDCEHTIRCAPPTTTPKVDGAGGGGLLADSHIAAAARQRRAVAALGFERVKLLRACAVDDLPWAKLGERLRCDAKTAMVLTVEAIAALGMFMEGRTPPLPPTRRQRIQPGSW